MSTKRQRVPSRREIGWWMYPRYTSIAGVNTWTTIVIQKTKTEYPPKFQRIHHAPRVNWKLSTWSSLLTGKIRVEDASLLDPEFDTNPISEASIPY
jgi:hypothetical protein